ncbi:MAG: hypothetical protein IAI50_02195 [Candidatus Eremiobacteraeota bacterium]|nr:hypothetical protein [Candidatus Eremiobacteraeota bacterium]
MTSADAEFGDAANAAATAFAATPPYVTYRLHLRAVRGDAVRDEHFRIAFRTSDGNATVTIADGKPARRTPPALPPAVDALAQWAFAFDSAAADIVMRVTYEHPKRFAFATPGPNADVVAPSVLGYDVRHTGDDPGHLLLTPATADMRAFAAQPDHFVYRDVDLDATSSLPRRVTLAAPDETLTLDYAVVSGAWLLSHVTYDAAQHGARGAIERYAIDATYDDYAFPTADPLAIFSAPAALLQ